MVGGIIHSDQRLWGTTRFVGEENEFRLGCSEFEVDTKIDLLNWQLYYMSGPL